MNGLISELGRRALFMLPAQTAHKFAIAALKQGLVPKFSIPADSRLIVSVAGLDFANPLGMAAGFDKNAESVAGLFSLGFGAVEIGSVTPRPQDGNASPRLFRLANHHAIINRMGFNNEGHAAVLARLQGHRHKGVLGVNIGANKDSDDRIDDYVKGISAFHSVADYFTVNISSPNTPGLRNLQTQESLAELFSRVLEERDSHPVFRPVFVKIAPDLVEAELDAIARECLAKNIDGVVISNTTLSRVGVARARDGDQIGGLSGRPLFDRSTIVLAKMRQRLGKAMPIIGVGGVESAKTAEMKIRAGADLIQIYTGFIYEGVTLPGQILDGLTAICERAGLASIGEIRDSAIDDYANQTLPDQDDPKV